MAGEVIVSFYHFVPRAVRLEIQLVITAREIREPNLGTPSASERRDEEGLIDFSAFDSFPA